MIYLDQGFQVDEHWVACEGGKRLVGGICVACGAQWKHLPIGLTGQCQKVNELVSCIAQVSDAKPTGERGRVKQDATAAWESHPRNLQDSRGLRPFFSVTRLMRISEWLLARWLEANVQAAGYKISHKIVLSKIAEDHAVAADAQACR